MVRRKATGHTVTMRTDRRWDGEIVALAVPAAATLAAEPAYLLTDTALVGTLGTEALAGLAVANTIILAAYTVFIFDLRHHCRRGTTPGRRAAPGCSGGGRHRHVAWRHARRHGGGGGVAAGAHPCPSFGAEAAVVADAVTYLRISTAGFPALLIVMAAQAFVAGTTTPGRRCTSASARR